MTPELDASAISVRKQFSRVEIGEDLFVETYNAYLNEQVELDVLRSLRTTGLSSIADDAAKKRATEAKRVKERAFQKMSNRIIELINNPSISLDRVQWAVNDAEGVVNITIS